MVTKSDMLFIDSERKKPITAESSPVLEPFHVGAGLAEEFHLHLLELQRAEYEVAGCDLVAEALAYLADAERDLPSAGPENALIINEDALGSLGTVSR